MPWYYLYDIATGNLVSETSVQPDDADITAKGLAYQTFPDRVNQDADEWDHVTKGFKARPKRYLLSYDSVLRYFTKAEARKFIQATRTNTDIELIRERLISARRVFLTQQEYDDMLNDLVQANVLTQARRDSFDGEV